MYLLETEQLLAAPLDEVFDFFADAFQLQRLTPPWLHFSVLTEPPIEIREGTQIDYKLRLHGLPIRWRSEIAAWDPPYRFVDRQIKGPYRHWWHEHTFEARGDETIARDRVEYAVPGGALAHWLLVKRDLRKIFSFRREVLDSIFLGQEASVTRAEL